VARKTLAFDALIPLSKTANEWVRKLNKARLPDPRSTCSRQGRFIPLLRCKRLTLFTGLPAAVRKVLPKL
jgi:hypothetical protein